MTRLLTLMTILAACCATSPASAPTVADLLRQPTNQALATLRKHEHLAPALVEALGDPDLYPRAFNLLNAWWPDSLPTLERSVAQRPSPISSAALEIASEKASRAQWRNFLLVALKNPDDRVKADAAYHLATFRNDDVLAAVLAAYTDMRPTGLEGFFHGTDGKGHKWFYGPGGPDFQVADAVRELIGSDTAMLLRALRHNSAKVRAAAAGFISMWWHNQPEDRASIEAALRQALSDPSKAVRDQAAVAHKRLK